MSNQAAGLGAWDEEAQDHISALLGQVPEEGGEEDNLLDLAAIRQALAHKEAEQATEEETKKDPQQEEPGKRLEWLDKLLASDKEETAAEETQHLRPVRDSDPKPRLEDLRRPVTQPTLREPGATWNEARQAATSAHLFKDVVVAALVRSGVVPLPNALEALEEQTRHPGTALWRVVADVPGVDRERVLRSAADLLGYAVADIGTDAESIDFVVNVIRTLPTALCDELFARNLLPLNFKLDPVDKRHSLQLASADPSHPSLKAFIETLGMPVDLFFAPELLITNSLEQARKQAAQEEDNSETGRAKYEDSAPEEPVPAEGTIPEMPEIAIQDLLEETEFFELHWEPVSVEEEDEVEVQPDTRTAHTETPSVSEPRPEVAWKPIADFIDTEDEVATAQEGLSSQVLSQHGAEGHDERPQSIPQFDTQLDQGSETPRESSLEPPPPAALPSQPEKPAEPDDQVPQAPWAQGNGTPPPPEPPVQEPVSSEAPESSGKDSTLPDVDLEKIKAKDRVVAMLLRKSIVTPKEVQQAEWKQKQDNLKEPLWRVMTLLDGVHRNAIFAEAASVYAFRTAEMGEGKPDPDFARSVMDTFEEELRDGLLQLRVVPFEVDLDQQTGAIKVVFITHDPTRPEVHRMMQKLKLERFELRYAPESIVTGLIVEAFPRRNEFLERLDENNAYDLGMSYDDKQTLVDEDALEAEISRSKLINLFEATLMEAVRLGASDVHIWPNGKKQVEIHMRIDGRLQRWHLEDKIHPEALIAVIKDNSMNVDRFERDAAQDGFIQRWIDEALIRFRVSVLPIANAATDVRSESIVIRVLDDRKVIKDLRKLGLHELSYQRFRKAISQPHGMVILTGPTGSGKTTTLYASLHEVVTPEVNVLTVEDPVEYILPGVRQIKLNNKLGLEGALRSILRHDPDVVMVGEMRDRDTAELAIKLANTGHLTFSTLHTNDAASAVTRLYKMGIEPFLIAYAINLVVAQRLIRRLCPQCKQVDPDPDPVLLKNLGFKEEEIEATTLYVQGEDEKCPHCKGLGYKGRRAVTEALYFSREIRHLIADSEGKLDEQDIKDLAMKQGMMTLQDSAREVAKDGDTSVLEMLRVISSED